MTNTRSANRSFPSAGRQLLASLMVAIAMVALSSACLASTLYTDISLKPVSERIIYSPGRHDTANVIIFESLYHNVFMERHSVPYDPFDPYVDRIRVVTESLGLPDGHTFWSFAKNGTHYNVKNSWQVAGQTIPNLSKGTPDPPVPGTPVYSETFTLAFTLEWQNYFSGGYVYRYGWVQLQLDPPLRTPFNPDGSNDLILLGGAYTDDPRGIVVGEYRVVPEPTSGVLASVSASIFAAIALMKRKRYPT